MTSEPAIVSWGRMSVADYDDEEYLLALRHAFVGMHADYIALDSNRTRKRFLAASVAWAIDEGLLYCDTEVDEGQTFVSSFRLTDKGRNYMGLTENRGLTPQPTSG
jgi:hypothetical protein